MRLELEHSLTRNVITPYRQGTRLYHLLFLRKAVGPLMVRDTSYKLSTLLTIGEIYTVPAPGKIQVVGNIFWTKSKVKCEGTYLLAYSGLFAEQLERRTPTDVNMELVLKEKGFQMFHQRNRATLIISPAIKRSMRENLEI